jgi:hypothetical protein
LSLSSQKDGFGIRDPRSGIRKKPIPDPGSMGQKGTGSRIPEPGSGSPTLDGRSKNRTQEKEKQKKKRRRQKNNKTTLKRWRNKNRRYVR